jgi:predicted AAA+ superfamily ATPase
MSPQEYWYPAFKLVKNPFRLFEVGMEQYEEDIPFLDVPMKCKVEALVKAKQSCIIKGPRGCGKSTVIQIVQAKGEEIFRVATPKSVDDACNQIFNQFDLELMKKMLRYYGTIS